MDDEEELVFKRFAAEKQDQVRGLVNYAMLMGLTGKDLVSIGGKLDRIKSNRDRKHIVAICEGFNVMPIGKDKDTTNRFKLKTAHGDFNFVQHYGSWRVTSMTTKTEVRHDADYYNYDFGRLSYDKRKKYAVLMDVHTGKLMLNF